jgi:hypothetical protein
VNGCTKLVRETMKSEAAIIGDLLGGGPYGT